MIEEVTAAVAFLIRLIEKNPKVKKDQMDLFKKTLIALLVDKFENHWFPDQPSKGQGYRCIRVNRVDRRDAMLEQAAFTCGLKYEDLNLPIELTLWVDPYEICCRFGEHHGSYCTVASFSGKENKHSVKTNKIDARSAVPKEVKSEVIPLCASGNGGNRSHQSVNQVPEQNCHNLSHHGHLEWNNQCRLSTRFPSPPLQSWYTLIPRWLATSPPPPPPPPPLPLPSPQFHQPIPGKWSNQGSPYHHWQYHRV